MRHIDTAEFTCPVCDTAWRDEIPPVWTGLDCWPTCPDCGPVHHRPVIYRSPILEAWAKAA